jgi:hypothetical protein
MRRTGEGDGSSRPCSDPPLQRYDGLRTRERGIEGYADTARSPRRLLFARVRRASEFPLSTAVSRISRSPAAPRPCRGRQRRRATADRTGPDPVNHHGFQSAGPL